MAHGLPVRLEVGDRLQRDTGIAFGVGEGRDKSRGGWLAGRSRHRRAGDIHRIRAGAARGEQRRKLAAGGVVRVHVNWQVEALTKRRDELLRGFGAQQARHVLDRDDVCTGVDDLLREPQVVVERV